MAHSRSFAWILVSLLLLALVAPLQADITPSGDVDPTESSWWTGGGDSGTDAYIGKTADGSVIVNLGSDLSSDYGYVGYNAVATGEVTVDGIGSTWTNSNYLDVGSSGTGTLGITDGGVVSNTYGYMGHFINSSGLATVSGAGSAWNNSLYLAVGYDGTGTLNIADGGTVSNMSSGLLGCSGSASGTVTVSGVDSSWTNNGSLFVGQWGTGTMSITGNGSVSNTEGYLGFNVGSTGTVTVDYGTWINSDSLYVGGNSDAAGGTGELTLSNQGLVEVGGTLKVWGSGTVNITGGMFTVDSTYHGCMGGNGHLYVGREGSGTLIITGGGDVSNTDGYVGADYGSTGTATVSGDGSTWTNSGDLGVGSGGGTGTLTITDGGAVSNTHCYVGTWGGSGTVTVSGDGSTWTNSGGLIIGGSYEGTGTLTITDGGAVSNTNCSLGTDSTGTGTVIVSGAGSTWTNSSGIFVGSYGTGVLTITAGGEVSSGSGRLGWRSTGSGTVTVSGAGSVWTNSDGLYVGGDGTGVLTITAGGEVSNTWGYVGSDSGSMGTATVSGDGSVWTNSGTLIVGCYNGSQGTLSITDGGEVSNTWGRLGYFSGSTGTVTVDGDESTWTNSRYLYVGSEGTGTLSITGGGEVSSEYGYLGYYSGGSGTAAVSGAGSEWTSSGTLYVGFEGTGELNIAGGGSVSSISGYLGHSSGSTGTVTVSGDESTWTSSGGLFIGINGNGTLEITNGGDVSNSAACNIGFFSGSTGVVTVDGSGSTWTNGGTLDIGNCGTGTLIITDGGAVVSNMVGRVGGWDDASGTVTVSGAGSSWTISDALTVGYMSTGVLSITDGGAISNTYGYVGRQSGSTGTVIVNGGTWTNSDDLCVGGGYSSGGTGELTLGNGGIVEVGDTLKVWGPGTVNVTGGMLTVDSIYHGSMGNSGSLYVGREGAGTLVITGGGDVSNTDGYVGSESGSTGTATVSGAGSTWTNSGDLYVGGRYGSSGGAGVVTVQDNGQLHVDEMLKVWGPGTLDIGATGQVFIGEALVLEQNSTLTTEVGATIHMTGSAFGNESTNSVNLAGMGNLRLIFEGGSGITDPFEVAGGDAGAVMAGFENNFALRTLQIGGSDIGKVQFVDTFDNQLDGSLNNETLYVVNLDVGAGCRLDLNSRNLYYLNAVIDPTADIIGGLPTQIVPDVSASVAGVPDGYTVTVTEDPGSGYGMGSGGMSGGSALSCTFAMDETEVTDAIAASSEDYLTLKVYYDIAELTACGIIEDTLRPYWWDGSEWVLGGTTTEGAPGESLFAGINVDLDEYGLGYCGLDTTDGYVWVNINHASTYGAGGNIPEPATMLLLALGGLTMLKRRSQRTV